jgi:protein-tyrosine phosphatase
MQRRGLDLSAHRSRRLEPPLVVDADLVFAMEREQVREAILAVPEAWSRCFTLRELVRRAAAAGARAPDESLSEWLARVHAGRERSHLLGFDAADDVADPVGGSLDEFEHTATELEALLDQLVALGWGRAA